MTGMGRTTAKKVFENLQKKGKVVPKERKPAMDYCVVNKIHVHDWRSVGYARGEWQANVFGQFKGEDEFLVQSCIWCDLCVKIKVEWLE